MLQHMRITSSVDRDLIIIQSDFNVEGMYFFLKEFYPLLLNQLFSNKEVDIVTLNPEKDALCYELGNYKEVKINKDRLFINSIKNPTSNLLMQIACSTEFELGTLNIVCTDSFSLEQRVETVYKYFKTDIEESDEKLLHTFCYCESDGYIVYLANTCLTQDEIKNIITKAEVLK